MGAHSSAYIIGGISNFTPPAIWRTLSKQSETEQEQALRKGELADLYGMSFLWTGFEHLLAEAEKLQLPLERVSCIELGLSYPQKLCGLTEEEVEEDFKNRLACSVWKDCFSSNLRIRLRPTTAASASGMVPVNDALADLVEENADLVFVVAGGNVKGTKPDRVRLDVDESTEVLASLISPLDRRLTGATMLKLAAVTLARAFQHDSDLVPAIDKHIREQRIAVHNKTKSGILDPVHIHLPPDKIQNRIVWEPMRLMGLAPQSMGYSGLILSGKPEGPAPVRVIGAGAGIEPTSIRLRDNLLGSMGMMRAMDSALAQAKIRDYKKLWLFEAHNPFPGVIFAESQRLLALRGYPDSLATALLEDHAGASQQPFLISPAGGALAGHPITPTAIRLLRETAKALVAGHPAKKEPQQGVSYAAVSSVGGHHNFDGFFVLAHGTPQELLALESDLKAFPHDELDAQVRADQAHEASLTEIKNLGPLSLGYISASEIDASGNREYFGVAMDAEGRHIPFNASKAVCERLRATSYIGLPVKLDEKLQLQAFGACS